MSKCHFVGIHMHRLNYDLESGYSLAQNNQCLAQETLFYTKLHSLVAAGKLGTFYFTTATYMELNANM